MCRRRSRIRADTRVGHGDPSSAAAPVIGQMCSAQGIDSSESSGNQGGLCTFKGLRASDVERSGPEVASVMGEALSRQTCGAGDFKVACSAAEACGRRAIGSRAGARIGRELGG